MHVQHEQNAAFALDGYTRVQGGARPCVTLNQAGPGASNLLTGLATSYWNHAPVVALTPTVDSHNDGKGVFQELPGQDRVFADQVKYLGNVTRADRITEILGKSLDRAISSQGPTQCNVPRDFFNAEEVYSVPRVVRPRASPAHGADVGAMADLVAGAERPVVLAGAGVGWSEHGEEALRALADALRAPVATTYLHNDVFPAGHPLNARRDSAGTR